MMTLTSVIVGGFLVISLIVGAVPNAPETAASEAEAEPIGTVVPGDNGAGVADFEPLQPATRAVASTTIPAAEASGRLEKKRSTTRLQTIERTNETTYMLAISFSTRSSTDRNGSLHSTVR